MLGKAMLYLEAFEDLRNLYRGEFSKRGIGGDVAPEDVKRWACVASMSVSQTFDTVAVELARDYAAGILTWEFCDAVANKLFGVMTDLVVSGELAGEPKGFWQFYLAFDHSETVEPERREAIAKGDIASFLAMQMR